MEASPPSRPTAASERIVLLDALRGFAVFGIFVANLGVFSGWMFRGERVVTVSAGPLDGVVEALVHVLVEGKFYSLFSLLFGLGFALQARRAEAAGRRFAPFFTRRMLVLLGLGAAHLALWLGDILALYAVLGLVLLAWRRASPRALLVSAVVLWSYPVVIDLVVWTWPLVMPGVDVPVLSGALYMRLGPLWSGLDLPGEPGLEPWYTAATLGEWLRFNLVGVLFRAADLLYSVRLPRVLGMFCLGAWIVRSGLLDGLGGRRDLLRRVRLVGFAVGLPACGLMTLAAAHATRWPFGPWDLAHTLAYTLGVAPLALAYAATFALLFRDGGPLAVLAPVGRMALTCYLSQTLVGVVLFSGVGLGLAWTLGPTALCALAVAVVTGQVVAARWWLARFRWGPVERLWRRLGYGAGSIG